MPKYILEIELDGMEDCDGCPCHQVDGELGYNSCGADDSLELKEVEHIKMSGRYFSVRRPERCPLIEEGTYLESSERT